MAWTVRNIVNEIRRLETTCGDEAARQFARRVGYPITDGIDLMVVEARATGFFMAPAATNNHVAQ